MGLKKQDVQEFTVKETEESLRLYAINENESALAAIKLPGKPWIANSGAFSNLELHLNRSDIVDPAEIAQFATAEFRQELIREVSMDISNIQNDIFQLNTEDDKSFTLEDVKRDQETIHKLSLHLEALNQMAIVQVSPSLQQDIAITYERLTALVTQRLYPKTKYTDHSN